MKHILLALALTFGMSLQAQAFFIEPFLNYELGDNPDVSDSEYTTINIGARLGGSTLGLFYGLEYSQFSGDYEVNSNEVDLDGSDLGITVGYDFPILIRAYVTYFLMSEADIGGSELEGSGGMRLGVGFTMLPFVNINLESITRTYDELNGSSLNSDSELEGFALGVSIPLP